MLTEFPEMFVDGKAKAGLVNFLKSLNRNPHRRRKSGRE